MKTTLFTTLIVFTLLVSGAHADSRWVNPDNQKDFHSNSSQSRENRRDSRLQGAYDDGYKEGNKAGYKSGYDAGYKAGYDAAIKSRQRPDNRGDRRRPPVEHYSGWDINGRDAANNPDCHRYTLSVRGRGMGSARIMAINNSSNIIKVDNGSRQGYVCYSGPTQLELGKLDSTRQEVRLDLEGVGTFVFDGGDRGTKTRNNWHRNYWNI